MSEKNHVKSSTQVKKTTVKPKKRKNKKRNKIIYNVLLCLFVCVFIGCSVYLIKYFKESKESEETVDGVKDLVLDEQAVEDVEFDSKYEEVVVATDTDAGVREVTYINFDGKLVQKKFARVYRQNPDFIGWITIEDTDIDYPVMQTMHDEEYYIYRDFEKNSSSAGTLFADTSSDIIASDNVVIYGHNMHTGKMFHDLLEYEDEEFYKNHKTFTFNTINGDATYEVIAAFRTQIYTTDYTGFKYYKFFDAATEEEFMDYVRNCMSLTPYKITSDVKYGDKLLTLSTCAYHTTNGRYVVVAKKIKE